MPISERKGMPETVCTVCGKPFDHWDSIENLRIDRFMGYGSKYDLCRIRMDLCCTCFDRVLDWLLVQSVHNPIEEFTPDKKK